MIFSDFEQFKQHEYIRFLKRGIPTRKEELWKYTNVEFLKEKNLRPYEKTPLVFPETIKKNCAAEVLIVFVDGQFNPALSNLSLLPAKCTLVPLSSRLDLNELYTQYDVSRYPFAVLNAAFLQEGFYLSVEENTTIIPLIHVLYLTSNKARGNFFNPRNYIVAGKNAQVSVIEEYRGELTSSYFTNAITVIQANENATINYYKFQQENLAATHIAGTFIEQENNSTVNTFSLSLGSKLARDDVNVNLKTPHAACHMSGLYLLKQDNQLIDHHMQIDHRAELGKSSMHYKGILDKKSRAVFNGKVYVYPEAQKICSEQSNHNLLLSTLAEVNTKPELEVYADEVKCKHGATVGQLNTEALFYLRARGIEKNTALQLLTHAFAADIIDKIKLPQVKHYINECLRDYEES